MATPRFYLAAVDKNREKAWDQNYVTDRADFFWGRVKYQAKAAYVIIINSAGPPRTCTLDSVSIYACEALCHTLCVLRLSRASSGTKPRRLQLWKRVAIPQVILNNKYKLQPIATSTVSELNKCEQEIVVHICSFHTKLEK